MPRRRPPIRHDPIHSRLSPLWAGERRVRALALFALAAAAGYLAWRLGATFAGAALWLAVPLFLAEAAGFVQLGALAVQAWRVPAPGDPVSDPDPVAVVVIADEGADASLVDRTLVGCDGLRGVGEVITSSPLGLGSALAGLESEAVLVLAAGGVPAPDVIERASSALVEPDVVAVGLAVEFINADSLAHLFTGRSERDLVNRVIGPSLGGRGLASIDGSAFIARRSVVAELAADGALPPPPVLGAELLARGRCAFASEALVRTRGPDDLGAYLSGSERRARSTLRLLPAALESVGANARARMALFATTTRYVAGARAAVLLAVLFGALASGGAPLRASAVGLAAIVVPTYALSVAAGIALGRGTIGIGDRLRHALRMLGVHCSAVVGSVRTRSADAPSRGLASLSRMGALTGAVLALDALLIARGLDAWVDIGLPAFPGQVAPVVLALGVLTLVPMLDVLQLVALRRQDRRAYRLVSDLPATLCDLAARVRDISPVGARLELAGGPVPDIGDAVALAIDAPALDGDDVRIDITVTVRNARRLPDGTTTLGVELEGVSDEARLRLLRLYWVTLPELAGPPLLDAASARIEGAAAPVLASRGGRATLRGASGVAVASVLAAALPATVLASGPVVGALSQLSGSSGCIQQTGAGGCAASSGLDGTSHVVVTSDGRFVYSTAYASDTIARFTRDSASGALTHEGTTDGGGAGFYGLVVTPDGKHLYALAYHDNTVRGYSIDAGSGGLTPIGTFTRAGMSVVQAIAISSDGSHVYVGSSADASVTAFTRNATTGALSNDTATALSAGVYGVEISPDGRHAYASLIGTSGVARMSRAPGTGELTLLGYSSHAALTDGTGAALSPDGGSLYAAAAAGNSLVVFDRDASTGALAPLECFSLSGSGGCTPVTGLDYAGDVVVSGDGRTVYVSGFDSDKIITFTRDGATGSLSHLATQAGNGLDGVWNLGQSPDGTSVYAAAYLGDAVASFARTPNSAPTCSPVAGSTLRGVAISVNLSCTDAQGDPLTLTATAPSHGAVGAVDNANGRVVYTPAAGYVGPDQFTVSASDGPSASAPAAITLEVVEPTPTPTPSPRPSPGPTIDPGPPPSGPPGPGAGSSTPTPSAAVLPRRAADPPRALGTATIRGRRLQIRTRLRLRDRTLCRRSCRATVTVRARGARASSRPRTVRRRGNPVLARASRLLRPPRPSVVTLKVGPAQTAALRRSRGPGARVPLSATLIVQAKGGRLRRTFNMNVRLPGRAGRGGRVTGRVSG